MSLRIKKTDFNAKRLIQNKYIPKKGIKQLMAGGGITLIAMKLIPLLADILN